MSAHFDGEMLFKAFKPEELVELFGSRRKQYYELRSPLTFVSERFGLSITAPTGFRTDIASVPRAFRSFIDNDDPGVFQPAIIHDYICKNEGDLPEGLFDRKFADEVMLEGMEICGLPTTQRRAVYLAIRTGGRWSTRNT